MILEDAWIYYLSIWIIEYTRTLLHSDAILESGEAYQSQMEQYLNSKELAAGFQRIVIDMLLAKNTVAGAGASGL
jgi:hypothetical protein